VDLVAHCGTTTAGEYLHTLVLTDIHTTWTECEPLLNRSQETVTAAIAAVRQRLPFPLLGLDSDNGSEFINANLVRYCQREHITFTRSRPYKKNDQAHVEQKNWTHVRQTVGYGRYEGPEALEALTGLYEPLRLYMNFFQPTLTLYPTRSSPRSRLAAKCASVMISPAPPISASWSAPRCLPPPRRSSAPSTRRSTRWRCCVHWTAAKTACGRWNG